MDLVGASSAKGREVFDMPGQTVTLEEALPRSHYFVTVSRGTGMKTLAIRSGLAHLALALLPLLLVAGLGSSLYLLFHDDLMASLMARQTAMQYAYEDKIEGLRQDLERQSAQVRAERAKVDLTVHDLFSREATLETRAAVVADLATRTGSSSAPAPALPQAILGHAQPMPNGVLGYAPTEAYDGTKPHPLRDLPIRGPGGTSEDHASLMDDAAVPLDDRFAAAATSLDRVERDQTGAVARIGAMARGRMTRMRDLIETAGLSPDRYLAKSQPGVGGPYVPLPEGAGAAFNLAVADLRGVLDADSQLRGAMARIPVAMPLSGHPDVTSPFGARLDPFLGRPALHTGVDLRESYGSDIRATGAGRVVFAGVAGGYGNMVEVDHGSGLTTRYAHMGEISVAEGQTVERGTVLGHVGATGRATGPHLHYEVRIDGEPVDPTRFMDAGERSDLASLLATR